MWTRHKPHPIWTDKMAMQLIQILGLVYMIRNHGTIVLSGFLEVEEVKRKYLLASFQVCGCSTSGKVKGCQSAPCTRNHVQVWFSITITDVINRTVHLIAKASCTSVYLDFAWVSFWLMDPLALKYLYEGRLKPGAHRNWLDGVGCQRTKGDPFWVSFLDLI